MGLGHRDARTDVVTLVKIAGKGIRHHGTERIERHHFFRIKPLGIRSDQIGGFRIGEIGPAISVQPPRGNRQGAVNPIRT